MGSDKFESGNGGMPILGGWIMDGSWMAAFVVGRHDPGHHAPKSREEDGRWPGRPWQKRD